MLLQSSHIRDNDLTHLVNNLINLQRLPVNQAKNTQRLNISDPQIKGETKGDANAI